MLPAPELFTMTNIVLEVLISVGLILGVGTRYCAILTFVFVLAATAIAHRYWEYPAGAQQSGEYNHFPEELSIMGGAMLIFVTGAGRFQFDRASYRRHHFKSGLKASSIARRMLFESCFRVLLTRAKRSINHVASAAHHSTTSNISGVMMPLKNNYFEMRQVLLNGADTAAVLRVVARRNTRKRSQNSGQP